MDVSLSIRPANNLVHNSFVTEQMAVAQTSLYHPVEKNSSILKNSIIFAKLEFASSTSN
jgi:hypothetical protein